MNKKFCDVCGKVMPYHPENFIAKEIGKIDISPKVRGKGRCAHVVRSGETIKRYIYIYGIAKRTGEYGGTSEEIDICKKCILSIIDRPNS